MGWCQSPILSRRGRTSTNQQGKCHGVDWELGVFPCLERGVLADVVAAAATDEANRKCCYSTEFSTRRPG